MDSEFKRREKQKNFNRSTLNIDLGKFCGYDFKLDIYTFQDLFEKLYLKAYPKSALPDLLKNNFLEGAALMLVRDVIDIDDLWKRLKDAYGDSKLLLRKKLSELNSVENTSKARNPSKGIDLLSQLINLMKDLLQLSKRHDIENHLFYGDGLDRIYRLMGEGRVSRWFSERDDQETGKSEWLAVIVFLEKELKISQQKAIIFQKTPEAKKDSQGRGFYSDNNPETPPPPPPKETKLLCHICGQSDHVATNGPGYKKLIQYFVCPFWAGMTNAERLKKLKSKGLCFQCLFPGADITTGKHATGRCQRDFVCKHESHEALTTKKHVLVCEEHKSTQANKDLLQEFKRRCLTKNDKLPAHAKEIRISQSHYVRSPTKVQPLSDDSMKMNSNHPNSVLCVEQCPDNIQVSSPSQGVVNPIDSSSQVVDIQVDSSTVDDVDNVLHTDQNQSNTHVGSSPQPLINSVDSSSKVVHFQIDSSSPTVNDVDNSLSHPVVEDTLYLQQIESEIRSDLLNVNIDNAIPTTPSTSYLNEQPNLRPPFVDSVKENAVYMLQRIKVGESEFNLFYDSGAGDFVSTYDAITRLGNYACQTRKGPLVMSGVGDIVVKAPHGMFGVMLPLADGGHASMDGMCLEKITETFPEYPLTGKIEEDIRRAYLDAGGNLHDLPLLYAMVGGSTDFMIGTKYRCFFPIEIFRLPSGLSICMSFFKNVDGSRGVICGPHEVIDLIEKTYTHQASTFIAQQCLLFKYGYQINPDVSLLSTVMVQTLDEDDESEGVVTRCYTVPQCLKPFTIAEMVGSEITYSCPKCRQCMDCKNYEHACAQTIKEEEEQKLIEDSVYVDTEKCVSSAYLPLLADPKEKLAPNRHKAKKTYDQQLKRLMKNPEDKIAVLEAEGKLQKLGFVEWVRNLSQEDQKMLRESPIQNFIPWRIVFKESATTACRPVFDASQPTDSGLALNDITAKGTNMLNMLVEIFLRWRLHRFAFHVDVQKMYNAIKLKKEHWCLQRYVYQENLDPDEPEEEKVVTTAIYGVCSSGNQAQCAMRKTSAIFKDEYPHVDRIVTRDTYMDDCMSGGHTAKESVQTQKDLQYVLSRGGFTLKGYTVSGQPPDASLSIDGVNILTFGILWNPADDTIALNIKEVNFAKKVRGRKSGVVKEVPKNLTKRHCAAKAGEVFDFNGLVVPLIGGIKIDLHELSVRKLNWDDVLPDSLREIWCSHFQMMEEIKNVRWKRAVIPENAVNLKCTTLDFGDASQVLVCIAIYVRFKLKNGNYSTQLIFAKSRLVPDDMTQPRAELYAALVNTYAGEVVLDMPKRPYLETMGTEPCS